MQIKEIKISDIKLYKYNNKVHNKKQIELLKQTIKEYWFTNPETYLIFRGIKITNTTRKLIKEW